MIVGNDFNFSFDRLFDNVKQINTKNSSVFDDMFASKISMQNNTGFEALLSGINSVSETEETYNSLKADYISGKSDDILNVMLASEKANLSINTALQIRNSLVSAVQSIMSMQI